MKETDSTIDQWLEEHLVCPRDCQKLRREGRSLICPDGHVYPVIEGIPIMLLNEVVPTQWNTTATLEQVATLSQRQDNDNQNDVKPESDSQEVNANFIDPHVQNIVASTCGILYTSLENNLKRYPIPEMRLPQGDGKMLLDLGCNWGRWCVAAARKGYKSVGIDPDINAIRAARTVSRQLGVEARYVVADARYLPFASDSFDVVFSYSVLQHFSKENAKLSIEDAGRVLKVDGTCLIQLPNVYGIRCLYHQAKRRFREAREFEVRYWTLPELQSTFTQSVGPTSLSVDGFFGLGIQKSDVDLLPPKYQLVVRSSEVLRRMSKRARWMTYLADSIYVKSFHQ